MTTGDDPSGILKALRVNRRKIDRTKKVLADLYAEQNRLVIAGDAAGHQPAEMARAADAESGKALRESFGQKIRKHHDDQAKAGTRGKRRPAK